MTRCPAPEFVRVFRFEILLTSERLALSRMHWEGPHLVLTRGMRADSLSLFDEVKGASLRVRLFRDQDVVFRVWGVKYERVADRGFLFLDAAENEVALEAVCLVNAELELVAEIYG
jgi:hypothetical protein